MFVQLRWIPNSSSRTQGQNKNTHKIKTHDYNKNTRWLLYGGGFSKSRTLRHLRHFASHLPGPNADEAGLGAIGRAQRRNQEMAIPQVQDEWGSGIVDLESP